MQFSDSPWFAIQVRHGHEKGVALMLRQKGYEEFLPVYEVRRRWSDRIKQVKLPLFPGYLFCRFDASIDPRVVTTPGVMRVVGAGKTPIPVSDAEIEGLQVIGRSGLPSEACEFLSVGHRAMIEAGPLRGLQGFVLEVKNGYRLVLSVLLLQRAVAVEVDADWLGPWN